MAATWTPKFEGKSNAGTPLVLGRLETFAAGTSTPIATYTDQAGTVPNTNPVQLDAAGRANVWLIPGVKYKLVLKSVLGVIVWTVDNFSVADPDLAGTLNGAGGAGAIKYQLVEDGSGIRTLQSKLEELATSQDFTVGTPNQRYQFTLDAAARGSGGDRGPARLNQVVTLVENAPIFSALNLMSGLHVDGTGGKINFGLQNFFGMSAIGKTNITVANMVFESATTEGNDGLAAVTFRSDAIGTDGLGFAVLNCSFINTSWGANLSYETPGSGNAINARFIGNERRAVPGSERADTHHAAGQVFGVTMVGNTSYGSDDAAYAVSMLPTAFGGAATIVGNTAVDQLVHTDFSGAQQAVSVGNVGYNRVNRTASDPVFRAITSPSGMNPRDIVFLGNVGRRDNVTNGEKSMKFDSGGASIRGIMGFSVVDNAYVGSSNAEIAGLYILDGGELTIANGSDNLNVAFNTFQTALDIRLPANPGLAGRVSISPQGFLWNVPGMFFPNYITLGGPLWSATTTLIGSKQAKEANGGTVTAGAGYVDVPGGVFSLDQPAFIAKVIALANLSTGNPGNLAICTLGGTILARYRFFTATPGTPANFVSATQDLPAIAGNAYFARLEAGVYKMMINSESGTLDLLYANVERWDSV